MVNLHFPMDFPMIFQFSGWYSRVSPISKASGPSRWGLAPDHDISMRRFRAAGLAVSWLATGGGHGGCGAAGCGDRVVFFWIRRFLPMG